MTYSFGLFSRNEVHLVACPDAIGIKKLNPSLLFSTVSLVALHVEYVVHFEVTIYPLLFDKRLYGIKVVHFESGNFSRRIGTVFSCQSANAIVHIRFYMTALGNCISPSGLNNEPL